MFFVTKMLTLHFFYISLLNAHNDIFFEKNLWEEDAPYRDDEEIWSIHRPGYCLLSSLSHSLPLHYTTPLRFRFGDKPNCIVSRIQNLFLSLRSWEVLFCLVSTKTIKLKDFLLLKLKKNLELVQFGLSLNLNLKSVIPTCSFRGQGFVLTKQTSSSTQWKMITAWKRISLFNHMKHIWW